MGRVRLHWKRNRKFKVYRHFAGVGVLKVSEKKELLGVWGWRERLIFLRVF